MSRLHQSFCGEGSEGVEEDLCRVDDEEERGEE
jgi:hypothetical protein